MTDEDGGTCTALLVTDRGDVSSELLGRLDVAGFSACSVSSVEALEAHADTRPDLVLVDLALEPADETWSHLARLFPRSALWALLPDTIQAGGIETLAAAFQHGCQDYLIYPPRRGELSRKLADAARAHARDQPPLMGDLDRYMTSEVDLELPSDLSVIEPVVRLLAHRCRDFHSYSPRTLLNLRVAVSEALSNAILYGNADDPSKTVRVRATVDAWRIDVQVTDEGSGFDPAEVPDPTRPDAIDAPGGRGLFLLHQLADDVEFNERGNSITLVLESGLERDGRPRVPRPAGRHVEPVLRLVERIRNATSADLHLWMEGADGSPVHVFPDRAEAAGPSETLHWLRAREPRYALELREPEGAPEDWVRAVRDLVDEALAYESRLGESRRELAEVQEQIELLHTITETLGAVTHLEDAADEILKHVVQVTGAGRASLWIYEPESEELVLAASEGPARASVDRVSVSSGLSVSALAFRENRTIRLDEMKDLPAGLAERLSPRPEPWVAVPVSYTRPGGATRTVGVLNLIGRRTGSAVSGMGETRLLMTLARQIGGAIENLKLFDEVVTRERLIGELSLAHDLQMKLLPDLSEFREVADVAARCVPARPVGGDFYQLFKLPDGKLGAMLADVTSHGFGAALIMALSMSAAGIYARETARPASCCGPSTGR